MKRNVICIVSSLLDSDSVFEEVKSLVGYLIELRDRTSNPDTANAVLKIVSGTRQDDLSVKKARLLQEWEVEVSDSFMELSSSLAVISLRDTVREFSDQSWGRRQPAISQEIFKSVEGRMLTAQARPATGECPRGYRPVELEGMSKRSRQRTGWLLSPFDLFVRLFPVRWYEAGILEDAFPNEPFVDLAKTLKSPFASAAQAIRGLTQGATFSNSSNGGSCVDARSTDLINDLEAVDRIMLDANPEDAAYYFCSCKQGLASYQRFADLDHFELRSETGSGGIPICYVPLLGACCTNPKKRGRTPFAPVPGYEFEASCRSCNKVVDFARADALLYLAITGAVRKPIPLRIAMAVLGPSFEWSLPMSQVSTLGRAFPELPLSGVTVEDIHLENNDLVLGRGESKTVVSRGWRRHTDPILGHRRPSAPSDPDQTELPPLQPAEELMRHSNQLVWLSASTPPEQLTLLCPDAITLTDLLPHVDECLKMWRGQQIGAAEKEKRTMPSGSFLHQEIVLSIAEGLYRAYAPWPDPLDLREDSDESWQWSPEKCLQSIRPLFKQLASAPLRGEPPNQLANFLYLIRSDRMICHAWPTRMATGWHFKLRTQDHTWITGVVCSIPEHLHQPHDASFTTLQVEQSYSDSVVIIRYANIYCEIKETKK